MTAPLNITLIDPLREPIVGATCLISPDPANPTVDGTVLSTAQGLTDANGQLTLNLIPSSANTHYVLHVNQGTNANVIAPFRFQMPNAPTTLNSLLSAALANREPVPEGIHVNFPSEPYLRLTYDTFTDIDIPVGSGAFAWGSWTEIYRVTNTDQTDVITKVVADLNFDPAWAHNNGDRGEIDIQICHFLPNGTIKQILVHHEYIYIRNQAQYNEVGSAEVFGIAELVTGEYIAILARGARQLTTTDGNRKIVLVGADSGVQLVRYNAITPATIRVATDPATMLGSGSTTNPIKPLVPFTQPEKDKLATVADGAQPPQDRVAIRNKLQSFTNESDKLQAEDIGGLNQASVPEALNDLSDVTISNRQVGDLITADASGFVNSPPHALDGATVVDILEHRPEGMMLKRSALQGQTTVEGGMTLPAVADVGPFTLFVRQDSSADNPALYLTGATYNVPLRDRNRVVLSVDRNGLYSINPIRGSASDNYNSAVGTYAARARAGSGQVTLALYADPAPPTTIYVRGIGGDNNVFALTRSGPGFINGRTYSVYSATIAANVVQNAPNTTQTLTFWSNAAGNVPINLKPASVHHAKSWHLQSPVTPDYSVTDPRSPAFIKNKPVAKDSTTIGRLIAKSSVLPTTSTTFSPAGTISRYTITLGTADAEVTTNYTVSGHSVASTGAYPKEQIGWLVRAMIADTERCRVFIPLSPTRPYSSPASILDSTRVCGHTYFGVSGTVNYYLGYQLSVGNQDRPAGTGNTATNIEIIIAANLASASVTFPAMTTIEVREAVV